MRFAKAQIKALMTIRMLVKQETQVGGRLVTSGNGQQHYSTLRIANKMPIGSYYVDEPMGEDSVSKSSGFDLRRQNRPDWRQQCLNTLPLPHGQRSFRPSFSSSSLSP
jgi:hypothetical protein